MEVGMNVKFGSEAINEYYGLPFRIVYKGDLNDIDEDKYVDDYSEWKQKQFGMKEVHQVICGKIFGHIGVIDLDDLLIEAHVWFCFINSRMMPSSHSSTCSRGRQMLIYSLMMGLSIDVGKLLLSTMKDGEIKSLFFFALITGLCHRAGVKNKSSDDWGWENTTINDKYMKQYVLMEKNQSDKETNGVSKRSKVLKDSDARFEALVKKLFGAFNARFDAFEKKLLADSSACFEDLKKKLRVDVETQFKISQRKMLSHIDAMLRNNINERPLFPEESDDELSGGEGDASLAT